VSFTNNARCSVPCTFIKKCEATRATTVNPEALKIKWRSDDDDDDDYDDDDLAGIHSKTLHINN
jgi:hypothetical protein